MRRAWQKVIRIWLHRNWPTAEQPPTIRSMDPQPLSATPCFQSSDLAPGDGASVHAKISGLRLRRVASPGDPAAWAGYDLLAREFGQQGEMESWEVIESRLRRTAAGDSGLLYEMVVAEDASGVAAVRDHTAVLVSRDHAVRAVVHLSHAWVRTDLRRQGLGGWLRALPLQAARELARRAGAGEIEAVALVSEMEHPDPPTADRVRRLKSYGRAGFLAVDPAVVPYHQPNFDPQKAIDTGAEPRPMPMRLVIRRVGREHEKLFPASELRELVGAVYQAYGADLRAADMRAAEATLARYPADYQHIPLVDPAT